MNNNMNNINNININNNIFNSIVINHIHDADEYDWDDEISLDTSGTHDVSSGCCTPPPTSRYLTIETKYPLTF